MLTFVLLVFSVALNVLLAWISIRATKRMMEFDNLFQTFVDDIRVNVKYLDKLSTSDLLSNAPEVVDMHRNFHIIRKRLNEFGIRFGEARNAEEEIVEIPQKEE